jgi:hypothetical protein
MAKSVPLVANLSFILYYEDFLLTINASVCLLQIRVCRSYRGVTKEVTTCIPVLCC